MQDRYESFHGIVFNDDALRKAIELSVKYMHDRFLPDKAMDILDEAGAYFMLNGRQGEKISEKDIVEVSSIIFNIPDLSMDVDDMEYLKSLEERLTSRILGQEEAVSLVLK